MGIKRGPLEFHNVIGMKVTGTFEEMQQKTMTLRNEVVRCGAYGIGPVLYQMTEQQEETAEYTIYMPLNVPVDSVEKAGYLYWDELRIEDGIKYREPDPDDASDDPDEVLMMAAEANGLLLQKPFYYICLNVFGESLIDIYAPIIEK